MKRIFALMLALLLAFSLVACSDEKTEEEEEFNIAVTSTELVYKTENEYEDAFYYEYINGDEVSIVGFAGAHKAHPVTIPETIDNRPVTDIAAGAFNSQSNVSELKIPNSVISIGAQAFNDCAMMTKVTMPNKLESLGGAAFANCVSLKAIELPATLSSMDKATFYNCRALESIVLPAAIEVVPEQAFMGCASLVSVSWSATGTEIGNYAFMGCTKLATINIDVCKAATHISC